MIFRDTGGGGDFEPAPADTHIARCYQIIDLGTHYNEMFDNRRHQVYIGFELPNALRTWKDDEGEHSAPYAVGKFYTMSLNEKANLRHDLESWRGRPFTEEELKGFDPKKILGAPAIVTVVHETKNGKTKAKITAISKIMKGMECPAAVNEPVFFSLEDYSEDTFQKLSKGFQEMIRKSEEWQKMQSEGDGFRDDDPSEIGREAAEEPIPF